MSLPIYSSTSNWSTMQTNWAKQLNPLIVNPSLQSIILSKVNLSEGSNTINHMLGRQLQGWRIVRQRAQSQIWDNQDSNSMPTLTLILNSSASVVCDIEVF